MLQSTSTSSSGSGSSSSGGHQSVKEQHLGRTISHSNTFAQPSLHSADCDITEHVHQLTTLSRSGACSNNNSSNNNNNNNTCKLILSFSVTFVAIHQLLVHPSLTLLMTSSSSSSSSSQSSHYHAKRCVETSEPNIFHCTDYATTPSSRSKSNSNEQQRGKDSILHDNNYNNDDVITNKYRGVAQYVSGSEDERRNMVEVLQSMEQYWRRWMLKTASIMQQYDEIEFANIWYVVVFVMICLS
jgi:hypothetical protein